MAVLKMKLEGSSVLIRQAWIVPQMKIKQIQGLIVRHSVVVRVCHFFTYPTAFLYLDTLRIKRLSIYLVASSDQKVAVFFEKV